MTILPPLQGDPDTLLSVAGALQGAGERVAAISSLAVSLRTRGVWDSPAGEAFGRLLDDAPRTLDAVARRYAAGAGALRTLAPALAECMRVANPAVLAEQEAWQRHDALEREVWSLLDGGSPQESPEILAVRAEQRRWVAVAAQARDRHGRAMRDWAEANERCARHLDVIATDGLEDSFLYNLIEGIRDLGSEVAAGAAFIERYVPPARVVGAVAGGVAVAAEGALAFGYGDGDPIGLGVDLLASALGVAGRVARGGSKAEAALRGPRVVGRPGMSTGQRIGAGLRIESRATRKDWKAALRGEGPPVAGKAVNPPPAIKGLALRARVAQWKQTMVTDRINRFTDSTIDELLLVTAGGPNAVRLAVSGVGLRAASAATRRVGSVLEGRREDDATAAQEHAAKAWRGSLGPRLSLTPCERATEAPSPPPR